MPRALWIRLQVDQHSTLRGHVAGTGIVLEIIPGNLIEAAAILAIDDDLDVVQLGASALFELNRLGSADLDWVRPCSDWRWKSLPPSAEFPGPFSPERRGWLSAPLQRA